MFARASASASARYAARVSERATSGWTKLPISVGSLMSREYGCRQNRSDLPYSALYFSLPFDRICRPRLLHRRTLLSHPRVRRSVTDSDTPPPFPADLRKRERRDRCAIAVRWCGRCHRDSVLMVWGWTRVEGRRPSGTDVKGTRDVIGLNRMDGEGRKCSGRLTNAHIRCGGDLD